LGIRRYIQAGKEAFNALTAAQSRGSRAVVIADAIVAAPPYHKHVADETFVIEEGTFELINEGVAHEAGIGAVVQIPGCEPHTIRFIKPGSSGAGKTIVILCRAVWKVSLMR